MDEKIIFSLGFRSKKAKKTAVCENKTQTAAVFFVNYLEYSKYPPYVRKLLSDAYLGSLIKDVN